MAALLFGWPATSGADPLSCGSGGPWWNPPLIGHFVLVTSALYSWPTGNIDSLGYRSFGGGLQHRFGSGASGR